ncbi:BMC domain-containing protein [Crassaminicella profunda]|uniref:BMC domain-containing protein n=1 Tax=Crassaminicella profunda TaxID=1286698 RepID=UPI001CA6B89A|nr:BMC domain-containing protein [Crassaminicella profunda]QZY54139.1 BMC domain-containing protein [Crassaminicella profunda]
MSKLALGIIETVGLAAAIEAADTAVKSANIKIIGYELTKGNGMTTVKIEGTVGAVKAAIHAAVIRASKVNQVWGNLVIPRPSDGLKILICNDETVGLERYEDKKEDINVEAEPENVMVSNKEDEDLENTEIEHIEDHKELILEELEEDNGNIEEDYEELEIYENEILESDICNICKDPKCPRKKGDLRKMCIHYEELKKEGRFNK